MGTSSWGWLRVWSTEFDEERLGEATARRLRKERMRQVREQAGFTSLANTVNASLLTLAFWNAGIDWQLLAWLAVVIGGATVIAARVRRAMAFEPSGSREGVNRLMMQAVIMAFIWGIGFLMMSEVATSATAPILVLAITGMSAAGTVALYPVPRAAILWVVVMSLLATPAFITLGAGAATMIAFTCLYVPVVVRNVMLQAGALTREAAVRRDLDDEREISDQLLRLYEDDAADRRWETDADGVLTHIPEQFAAMLGHDPNRPAPFVQLLANVATPDADDALLTIAGLTQARNAFNDVKLAIVDARDGATRHVLLRGRPTTDARGDFAGYNGFATDVTSEREASDRAAFLATHDALTGLSNRVALNERMDGWIAARRPFALVALDLDRFKLVNDTLGHPAGDALLIEVSRRLVELVGRSESLVCRAAGDEFFVVLAAEPGTGDAGLSRQANRMAQRIVERLGQPYALDAGPAAVGSSAGTALFPRDAASKADLMSRADLALYAAKAGGRGIHHAWEPQMDVEASRRRCMESDLRHALEQGEMSLMFQPIYEMASHRPVGMEALLRWHHAERGHVSPAQFLPTAEATGLIVPIGEWVLREACREAATWREPLTVSVNVSVGQIAAEGFAATVMSAVASAGLPPQRLELDVTEKALIEDRERALSVIRHLRSFGVRIALDDFGTCYATMGAMHDLMFDRIKIDGTFVGDLDTRVEGKGTALVSAIVGLAAKFDIPATAECVEGPEQAALLRELGCATGQGYHFGRPTEPGEAAELAGGCGGRADTAIPTGTRTLRIVGGTASLGARARLAG